MRENVVEDADASATMLEEVAPVSETWVQPKPLAPVTITTFDASKDPRLAALLTDDNGPGYVDPMDTDEGDAAWEAIQRNSSS